MRYWFDTEFWEQPKANGGGIELISIGIVAEDGRTFYAENADFDWGSCTSQWLHDNVRPHLTDGFEDQLNYDQIGQAILDFVGEDDQPRFWGYFAAYDWVIFCWIFGSMMDLPKGWPMFCLDIKQWAYMLSPDLRLPAHTGTAHHALSDALWTTDAHDFLESLTRDRD